MLFICLWHVEKHNIACAASNTIVMSVCRTGVLGCVWPCVQCDIASCVGLWIREVQEYGLYKECVFLGIVYYRNTINPEKPQGATNICV